MRIALSRVRLIGGLGSIYLIMRWCFGRIFQRRTGFVSNKSLRSVASFQDSTGRFTKRSMADIAKEHGVRVSAIQFWMGKHGIKGRSLSETRKLKYWGAHGAANGMYGRCGAKNPKMD